MKTESCTSILDYRYIYWSIKSPKAANHSVHGKKTAAKIYVYIIWERRRWCQIWNWSSMFFFLYVVRFRWEAFIKSYSIMSIQWLEQGFICGYTSLFSLNIVYIRFYYDDRQTGWCGVLYVCIFFFNFIDKINCQANK